MQKNQTKTDETEGPIEESGLDLSDLDLSSIQFSEKEMRALSGLTPALSRRLQRQLLAHLPPHAARTLRRTLSLHAPEQRAGAHDAFVRSHSASKSLESDRPRRPHADADSPDDPAASPHEANLVPPSVSVPAPAAPAPAAVSPPPVQCSTLPRLRRRSTPRTEPPTSTSPSPSPEEASVRLRGAAERPLLSKYLTPERHLSVDEPFVSDSGSVLSEPPYGAAYGSSAAGSVRRSSLRLPNEQPKKRLSRFLRSDFFDTPPEESLYAKHKKEKELETQKILREIREKRNRALEASASKSLEIVDAPVLKDDVIARKSLSPVGASPIRERSRSNTPFFPILDNIKETNLDTPLSRSALKSSVNLDNSKQKSRLEDSSLSKETRLIRPKSYPVKTLDCIEEPSEEVLSDNLLSKENNEKSLATKESKLIRPKSYPTSSPSPEKVYLKPNLKKPENETQKEEVPKNEIKTDVEVSFSITLPKKTKVDTVSKTDSVKLSDLPEQTATQNDEIYKKTNENVLVLKKYQVVDKNDDKELSDKKLENGKLLTNGDPSSHINVSSNEEIKIKLRTQTSKSKDDVKAKPSESDIGDKKIVKKKIIRKVSSKSKTDLGGNTETEPKTTNEKKKVTKKVKDKNTDDDASKAAGVAKKKSVLQTISHKLEKLASAKSNSPEKTVNEEIKSKKDISKLNRMQREQSVPVNVDPPITESNLIKRAVTLTDVAALENENTTQNKTTVSKVLGLFKKFEPKEKPKPIIQKSQSEHTEENINTNSTEPVIDISLENINKDKVRRPTSLLLNGLGRKAKNAKGATDNVPAKSSTDNVSLCTENEDHTVLKIDETKNLRNSLKLDLSRLPRVKKIVPTNPVIEPQMMNVSPEDCEFEKKEKMERSSINLDGNTNLVSSDSHSRSRSRSRSTISNSELNSSEAKSEKNPISPSDNTLTYPLRNHDSTTPEKDDLIDRIRRKSFYSRFNEKKQRRKSSLVGPGATEYDPLAIIHGAGGVGGETKPEPSFMLISPVSPISPLSPFSPISPAAYDLSPGLSASSDLSPSTERYRSLLTDTPGTARTHLRFDNYGVNDKIDTYRSLDRNDFRKYPGSRSYLDYDQPSSYGTMRYSRTKSLLESPDGSEDNCLTNSLRDPHKYNRTISMYSPGNYATYRPRTRNPAIILKESEKEPSPENILEKIKQRKKISISVTRKPDPEKETLPRSTITPKGESDGAECSEKVD